MNVIEHKPENACIHLTLSFLTGNAVNNMNSPNFIIPIKKIFRKTTKNLN